MKTKNIILIVVAILIVGAIYYLEGGKAGPGANTPVVTVTPRVTATSTVTVASSTVASATGTTTVKPYFDDVAAKAAKYPLAKEITTPDGYINADSSGKITIGQYIGKKVILVDFWTYSCINCQRTTPYLNAWYSKYKDLGLVIIGIQTPEFDFEKVYSNVQAAVNKEGIQYPVVLDNDYSTWNAYGNLYWPHQYLIDIDGYITYDHIGEGDYQQTETAIQNDLVERANVLGTNDVIPRTFVNPVADTVDPTASESPETYFGSARNEYLANGQYETTGPQTLAVPTDPSQVQENALYLDGNWNFQSEYAQNTGPAKIIYKYSAAKVYFVASSDKPITVKVLRDGVPVSGSFAGTDVVNGMMTVQASTLYNLINEPSGPGTHTLEIDIPQSGLQAFTFTFG